MSKVTMPEPVARQIRYFDSDALSRTYGEWSEWKMFTGKYERMGLNEKRGLITTDQAEAYADVRVRVALEAAAAVAEERSAVLPHYSDFIRGYANGRKDAASVIRALLPKEIT